MAINVVHDLVTIFDQETDPNYLPEAGASFAGFQREGTAGWAFQVSNELIETWASTPATLNLTGKAVYAWIVSYGQLATYANGGIGLIFGDDTNRIAYYTGGKDRIPFQAGGWQCHMVDSNNPPTLFNVLAGAEADLNWAAITEFGYRFYTLAKSLGGAVNCFVDIVRYGTGLTLQGGTSVSPATFISAALDDADTAAGKAYGIIREIQPNIYGVQGRLDIGDTGSNSSWFEVQDDLVVWENWGAGNDLYSTTIIGNADGTNVVKLGQKIGDGDTALGANGCTFQSSGPNVRFSWTGSSHLTSSSFVNIYGTKFFKIVSDECISFNRSGSDFIGNVIDQCTQVILGDTIVRNCTFSGTVAMSGSILWSGSIDIKNCAFNNNTIIGTNPPNINAAIEVPNVTGLIEVTFDNLSFSGNDYDVLSQYSGTLTINSTDSDVSTYTASVDGGDIDIINNVFLTVNVQDEAAAIIESASVWVATDDTAQTVLMNEYTNGSGVAQENYNYLADQEIIIRVRKSSVGDTRYNNIKTVGEITSAGFTLTVVMSEDINI